MVMQNVLINSQNAINMHANKQLVWNSPYNKVLPIYVNVYNLNVYKL